MAPDGTLPLFDVVTASRPPAALTQASLADAFDNVAPDWRATTEAFRHSDVGQSLFKALHAALASGQTIYPGTVLTALHLTRLDDVRVVILGQDPYHGPGQAHGLAFSVPDGVKVPPSLRNIFKELHRDLGLPVPASGNLSAWAREGVLLLNSALTVQAEQAGSHAGWGWEALTDALITQVAAHASPKVFMLWGAHAQRKLPLIDAAAGTGQHLVLQCNHPSPLAASRGATPFIGCGHFGLAQRWLNEQPGLHSTPTFRLP